ncbi:MAG: IclR family transcriptional regulator [Negativicutes bacterium]|nr:IclR family transcriptional regulator [Negativicutes bacterium]
MPKKISPYIVASVDRAVEMLMLLGKHQRDMGVTELSRLLGVQKSTVHSLLQTLLLRGFVRQTDSGRYALGFGLIRLGEACASQLDLRTVARPLMSELAEETQEIALLAVLSGTELFILDKVEPQRPFLIIPKFDFSITLHSTAIGKVLLANAPQEIIEMVLERGFERFTPFTLTEREELLAEMETVRREDYAIGCDETIEGLTCIAVPLRDASGKVIAALSVSSASSVLAPGRYERVIGTLRDKGRSISERLGFSDDR